MDSAAWTTTNDPDMVIIELNNQEATESILPLAIQQLLAAGGSVTFYGPASGYEVQTLNVPESLLNQMYSPSQTWAQYLSSLTFGSAYLETIGSGGIHTGALDPGQVQYTTGYNDQYTGVSSSGRIPGRPSPRFPSMPQRGTRRSADGRAARGLIGGRAR